MFVGKIRLSILFVTAAFCIGQITGCKDDPQPKEDGAEPNKTVPSQPAEPPSSTTSAAIVKPVTPPPDSAKPTLGRIIATRRGWAPIYMNWYGEQSPDFTVTDITGKSHTLSDYKGRNVMLVFWATWCRPCKMEIPHLYELRKTYPQDQLAILAISYDNPRNSTEMVREYVEDNPLMSYTVVSVDMSALPRPYNYITGIPCSFYIDPQGKIKLATEGLVSVMQMKQIIEAEQ
ncbi:MAG: redoxin domain-containing protein [Sedimentisphaerales bacterium]|nr:redoxin domain-containing protein [Sedimentisphaerales bacterium]